MKLSRAVGLAIAVSLVAGTEAANAQISGAASAGPTANVVDAAGLLRGPAARERPPDNPLWGDGWG